MHELPARDGNREIVWGRTSADYAKYRPGYPASFFERMTALGVGLAGQRVLDLGTGTGVLARAFAGQGCDVVGMDLSAGQVEAARELAERDDVEVDFRVGPAECTGLPDASFDVVTAAQSWLYFNHEVTIPEVKRLLVPGGRLMTCHICWLPRVDEIARRSEQLVLKHNPDWATADWDGRVPPVPKWSANDFDVTAMFYYDEPITFTRETWRGRIRACRGVGAVLSPEEVQAFDLEHAKLLQNTVGEEFTVLHRIDAHIFQPR